MWYARRPHVLAERGNWTFVQFLCVCIELVEMGSVFIVSFMSGWVKGKIVGTGQSRKC